MNRKRILVLLCVTAVVIAAAALMRTSQDPPGEQAEGPYFPDLLARSNDVAKVIVKDGRGTTTIVKDGDRWTIEEEYNYPASLDRVRELVLGLARLQRVEGKTSKPELYGKLGLDDIGDPGSTSTLVQLMDGSGDTLAVLIVGKEKAARGGSAPRRFYVRSPGDPQTWLVEGRIPDFGAATTWMDPSLFGPDGPEIRSVTISRGGASWAISRPNPETEVYELEGLAAGEDIDSQYAINQIARSFGNLAFEGVRPASTNPDDSPGDLVIAESFAGVRISLTLDKEGEQYFGRLSADYKPVQEGDEAIEQKVRRWNELWRNWEYLLSDYQVENIIVDREDLIKQETEPVVGQ